MDLISSNKVFHENNETTFNASTLFHYGNIPCMREIKNLVARKKIMRGHVILKFKKRTINPITTSHCHHICKKNIVTTIIPSTSLMTNCYQYQQDYSYPLTVNDWHQRPIYTVRSLPIIVPTPNTVIATHVCPYTGTVIQPILSPILSQTFVQDDVQNMFNYTHEYNYSTEQIEGVTELVNEQTYYSQENLIEQSESRAIEAGTKTVNKNNEVTLNDPLEDYLKLPKELFPAARSMGLDPNPVIDEFCKLQNIQRHTPWLLDLEFGVPKSPITRPIPTYNVKFNNINCKNAPEAVHPGFDSCDPDFKKALLFYYDCVASMWYKGYIIMNCDRSVENFQSWLQSPMQVLGMCWS